MQVASQRLITSSSVSWLAAGRSELLRWSQQCTCSSPAAAFSTQHEEEIRVPNPSQSQATNTPPVLGNIPGGNKNETSGAHYDVGRSSQTTSAQMAGDDMKKLVHRLFEMYESRSIEHQRGLIHDLYDADAVYENNVTLLQGRDAIQRRFGLLPTVTSSVKVQYEAPMVLGATTSGPEALDNLATKGDLQVEVNNTQSYDFDRSHSLWRYLLLPKGGLNMPVLTRLTLNKDGNKVLHHRDIWTHSPEWSKALQKCWGAVEKAAEKAAGTVGAAKH